MCDLTSTLYHNVMAMLSGSGSLCACEITSYEFRLSGGVFLLCVVCVCHIVSVPVCRCVCVCVLIACVAMRTTLGRPMAVQAMLLFMNAYICTIQFNCSFACTL